MNNHEKFWQKQAAQFARMFNFAWWLQAFLVGNFLLCSALALLIIVQRRYGFFPEKVWIAAPTLFLLVAVMSYLIVRRRFIHRQTALVHLEEANGLNNRLSSAMGGVGSWPEGARPVRRDWHWNWRVLIPSLAVSLALPLLALFIPVGKSNETLVNPTSQPSSWGEVQEWLDALKSEELIEPEALNEFEEQLALLRGQDPRDWYSHNSLEASDNLRSRMDKALQSLNQNLGQAQESLDSAQQLKDHLSRSELEELAQKLGESVNGLQMGTLPLNDELLKELKDLDPQSLRQLSDAKLKELQKALKNAQGKTQDILGNKGQSSELQYDQLVKKGELKPGQGGVQRGRGDAPLTLQDEKTALDTDKSERLKNNDMRNAALSDTLGISVGEHQIDEKAYQGKTASGQIESTGQGGETVWRYQFRPEEQDVLQNFYK